MLLLRNITNVKTHISHYFPSSLTNGSSCSSRRTNDFISISHANLHRYKENCICRQSVQIALRVSSCWPNKLWLIARKLWDAKNNSQSSFSVRLQLILISFWRMQPEKKWIQRKRDEELFALLEHELFCPFWPFADVNNRLCMNTIWSLALYLCTMCNFIGLHCRFFSFSRCCLSVPFISFHFIFMPSFRFTFGYFIPHEPKYMCVYLYDTHTVHKYIELEK